MLVANLLEKIFPPYFLSNLLGSLEYFYDKIISIGLLV